MLKLRWPNKYHDGASVLTKHESDLIANITIAHPAESEQISDAGISYREKLIFKRRRFWVIMLI